MRNLDYKENLFGLFLNINNFVLPIAEVGSHELINFWQYLVSDIGGVNDGKQCSSHVLVSRAMNCCNVAVSQYIQHGLWVTRNQAFGFIHKYVFVKLWIHRNNGRTPQNVRFEKATVPEAKQEITTV